MTAGRVSRRLTSRQSRRWSVLAYVPAIALPSLTLDPPLGPCLLYHTNIFISLPCQLVWHKQYMLLLREN